MLRALFACYSLNNRSDDETNIAAAAGNMGGWGVVYHYTVTVHNNGSKSRNVSFKVEDYSNLIVGYKEPSKDKYNLEFKDYYNPMSDTSSQWTPMSIWIPLKKVDK